MTWKKVQPKVGATFLRSEGKWVVPAGTDARTGDTFGKNQFGIEPDNAKRYGRIRIWDLDEVTIWQELYDAINTLTAIKSSFAWIGDPSDDAAIQHKGPLGSGFGALAGSPAFSISDLSDIFTMEQTLIDAFWPTGNSAMYPPDMTGDAYLVMEFLTQMGSMTPPASMVALAPTCIMEKVTHADQIDPIPEGLDGPVYLDPTNTTTVPGTSITIFERNQAWGSAAIPQAYDSELDWYAYGQIDEGDVPDGTGTDNGEEWSTLDTDPIHATRTGIFDDNGDDIAYHVFTQFSSSGADSSPDPRISPDKLGSLDEPNSPPDPFITTATEVTTNKENRVTQGYVAAQPTVVARYDVDGGFSYVS